MSEVQTDSKSKIHKLPFIIKKESIKSSSDYGALFRCWSGTSDNLIKEDIIYKAKAGDFLQGKYPALCILNRLDVAKNRSRTVAAYVGSNSAVIQLTSDAVVKLIGQANYDQVFASLCCVINQELKVKGILSLLCPRVGEDKTLSTVETQTYESSFTHLIREKQRRTRVNKRTKIRTYILPEVNTKTVTKKVIINPADFIKFKDFKVEDEEPNTNTEPLGHSCPVDIKVEPSNIDDCNIIGDDESLSNIKETDTGTDSDPFPDLKLIVDEDSNISEVGSIGNLSIGSFTNLPNIDSNAKSILNYIENHTEFNDKLDGQCEKQPGNLTITMVDGSKVTIRGNPDPFHIATPEILKELSPNHQKNIMLHQAYLDWKFCLQRDEDDNLPLHGAVLNNDVELLKRQCLILKSRDQSVDILAAGNLTALQMAIFQDCPECTKILLAHGADVMVRDEESRTALHLAAEIGAKHVDAILTHCMNNAREILTENDEFWKPELEHKDDVKMANYLLTKINTICDNQGYTPLMLASKMGNDSVVKLLATAAPSTVNMAMPTSGNTALYLAVGAACTEAASRGDKTTIPENFKKTVEFLVEHGADPSVENNSGGNVNILLTEFHDITLSFLIATKLSSLNGFGPQRCDAVMLLKDANGVISVANMTQNKSLNKPKVYSNAKTIKTAIGGGNSTATCKIASKSSFNIDRSVAAKSGMDGNRNTNIVTQPGRNCKNGTEKSAKCSKNLDKPVILKNLPVVTKIVSFGSDKPVLVKGIAPKGNANDKGLLTEIIAKPNTTKVNAASSSIPVGNTSNALKFLKILPKPEPHTSDAVKKTPILLKNAAVKRHTRDNDNKSKSSSKKTKK
ncbi:uncharacterized protein LOC120628305 [Pararge aegeria]|uniref:Jg13310 protein n=1 Tax=Pararge aegeria aegeria TaxID=348720 RepID=A0A8S4RF33_9NEOP|nr:uncharacterized protein LOC120628305 [Pararge aegeria]CAH2235463.1 jg13310 [Pararge aegeria aegeria]